jgi:hypothetical protein
VSYFSPDDFISNLQKLAAKLPLEQQVPNESVTRGFKVRRHGPTLTQEERDQKEQLANKILSEVMKRKP